MTHIAGFGRDQLLLLPEAVDDYVEADNSVRFIDAFVDGLDLAGAGFARVEAKATGRPGYAPGDLLKLYIYGYLNRVRSSRRLEREAQRNIEVIWLLRGLKPDFKTIADFRRDSRGAFKSVFRQFVLLCRRFGLYGRELLAVDGTRIKAVPWAASCSPNSSGATSSLRPSSIACFAQHLMRSRSSKASPPPLPRPSATASVSASAKSKLTRRPVADISAGSCHLVSGAATMANWSRMRPSKRRSRKWSLCGRRENR
jgi:transposase